MKLMHELKLEVYIPGYPDPLKLWLVLKYLRAFFRKKMGEYYHDILWRHCGQLSEESLLWDGAHER